MVQLLSKLIAVFYDNLILSGTKINKAVQKSYIQFYDNLILSGTKITDHI